MAAKRQKLTAGLIPEFAGKAKTANTRPLFRTAENWLDNPSMSHQV
jgi:hypothetical protein